MNFFDTSVIVASVDRGDPRYPVSGKLVAQALKGNSCCSAHSLAEVYAVLSGRPHPYRVPVSIALMLVEQMRERMEVVTLNGDESFDVVRDSAKAGRMGGIIYDALLLACARKVNADVIYTWNLRHFRAVAPDLAERIVEP